MFREEPYSDMEELLANDQVAKNLGIRMEDHGAGWCKLSLKIGEAMLNAYGSAHGGVIYSLADVAFAVACNSRGNKAVALSMSIHYRRPAAAGDLLTAEAREESLGRTTALIRIRITRQDGKLVAVADGLAFTQ